MTNFQHIFKTLTILTLTFLTCHLSAQDFITKWRYPAGGTRLRFSVGTVGTVNYTWTATPSGNSGSGSLTTQGSQDITINAAVGDDVLLNLAPSNLRRFQNNGADINKLRDVLQWGSSQWSNVIQMFSNTSNLIISATDIPNLTNCSSLNSMFSECPNITTIPNINNWDVSSVQSFNSMFMYTTSFNQDLNNWNTGFGIDFSQMFYKATNFNGNIGTWDVSSAESFSNMFLDAVSFNQDLNNWNSGSVVNFSSMFWGATSFNGNISNWNVISGEYLGNMFSSASSFNQDIGNWNTISAVNMSTMFLNAISFNQDISGWNVSSVVNMNLMLNTTNFNQNIGSWDLNHGVDLNGIFQNSNMNCANYSATLIGWRANNPDVMNRNLGAGSSQYGTNAAAARTALINVQGWTISDGGSSGIECTLPPLPVKLISFTAKLDKNNAVDLKWTTADEINLKNYIIQRSTDGSSFSELGSISASHRGTYNFADTKPENGMNYYRLKQVDTDGSFAYSKIVSIKTGSANPEIQVYPNPVWETVLISGCDETSVIVHVNNEVGAIVQKTKTSGDALSTNGLYVHDLIPGVYIVQVRGQHTVQTGRFVKM